MTDNHIECVSDFCGNYKSPGAWADIFERPNGSRYVKLGGAWGFYAKNPPEIIEATDPLYAPFLEACNTSEDFGFIAKHYGRHECEV